MARVKRKYTVDRQAARPMPAVPWPTVNLVIREISLGSASLHFRDGGEIVGTQYGDVRVEFEVANTRAAAELYMALANSGGHLARHRHRITMMDVRTNMFLHTGVSSWEGRVERYLGANTRLQVAASEFTDAVRTALLSYLAEEQMLVRAIKLREEAARAVQP